MTIEVFDINEGEQFGREIYELPLEIQKLVDISENEILELEEIAKDAEPFNGDKSISFTGSSCSDCSGSCQSSCAGSSWQY